MKSKAIKRISLMLLVVVFFASESVVAQIRSGAAFLNMMPGSRQHAMGNNLCGTIDDLQSFYANPAALGFYREYHFSGSYARWFTDIYHFSLNAGRRTSTFFSRKTQLALGIRYLGVKEFDSTLKNKPAASASDFLALLGVGFPMNLFSEQFAFGVNLKYFQSELYTFRASSWNADAGILWRSPRYAIKNAPFEFAHFSAGFSLSNWGKSLIFRDQATPLPLTARLGFGFAMGSHNGMQFQISANYQKIKDESGYFSLGGELSFGYRFAMQGGYNFNDHLLSKFSLGMSFRLDDRQILSRHVIKENSALRFDFAGMEKNEFFSETYRGNVSMYPLCPESFNLLTPAQGDTFEINSITFAWEKSVDPDLYDQVSYIFLLEREHTDKSKLAQLYRWGLHSNLDLDELRTFLRTQKNQFLHIDTLRALPENFRQINHTIADLKAGNYWWTVLAMDRDGHLRAAEQGVRQFHILFPDIEIKKLEFKPDPWITLSDTQGVISVTIANAGKLDADNIRVVLTCQSADCQNDTLLAKTITHLDIGDTATLKVNWLTPEVGKFDFIASAFIYKNASEIGMEANIENNKLAAQFYTIPKGTIELPDTVNAYLIPHLDHNLPLLPRVFFQENSRMIPQSYYQTTKNWLYPPLKIIAERLKQRHDLYISLEGFADNADGEPADLARKRVMAVKNLLLQFGVDEIQIPDSLLKWNGSKYRRATRNLDVREERRFVKISAFNMDTHEPDITLFSPIPFKTFEQPPVPIPITWHSSIYSPVPVEEGFLHIDSQAKNDFLPFFANLDSLTWNHSLDGSAIFLHQSIRYKVTIKDTLGRKFKTRQQYSYLNGIELHMPKVVGLADFNNRQPYPIIPWDELFDKLKLYLKWMKGDHFRFVGHACGIPPNTVNNIFSKIRANNFQSQFLAELKKRKQKDPELFELINARLDFKGTIGKGANDPFSYSIDSLNFLNSSEFFDANCYDRIYELIPGHAKQAKLEPFVLTIKNGYINLIGDNETPEGRQLNRRIELQLFVPRAKKQLAVIRKEHPTLWQE